MAKVCDNKSVGIIIKNPVGDVLLIERKKFPFGFAALAGHIDDFSSPEACARGEVFEEVGLKVTELKLVHEETKNNPCRREGGDHHHWWIYEAGVEGYIRASLDETKQVGWYSKSMISDLSKRTELYQKQVVSEADWENAPGLEPVWYEFFKELNLV